MCGSWYIFIHFLLLDVKEFLLFGLCSPATTLPPGVVRYHQVVWYCVGEAKSCACVFSSVVFGTVEGSRVRTMENLQNVNCRRDLARLTARTEACAFDETGPEKVRTRRDGTVLGRRLVKTPLAAFVGDLEDDN